MTRAQRIFLVGLIVLAGVWLGSLLIVPIAEYVQGPTPQSKLIGQLGHVAFLVMGAWVALAVVLQSVGILPSVALKASASAPAPPGLRLRNLAIWIVIALCLVFLFNLFQSRGGSAPAPARAASGGATDLNAILVNWVPMLVLIGVWIFIMRRMTAKKKDGDREV